MLRRYPGFTDDARSVAQTLLASRKTWALELLQAVDEGKIDPKTIPLDTVRRLTAHRDERLARLIGTHWGAVEGATTAAMQKQVERLEGVLRGATGSPYPGKKLFLNTCAKCHQLFGQGGKALGLSVGIAHLDHNL